MNPPIPKTPKSKVRSMANPDLGAPTPERRRRSAFLVTPAVATEEGPARAGSRVYRTLSTLDRMLRDSAISRSQAQAGNRLRDDFELGVAGAREPASGSVGTTGWYYPEARLAALRRYQDAVAKLGLMADYVLPIAVDDISLSALARRIWLGGRNRQECAGILKLGLDTLADHYGLK
jgi:hypothetical protein